MIIRRRDFLKTGTLATASLLVPRFLYAENQKGLITPGGKKLVIIQLSGGNDGLNMVIPYRNDIYYSKRRSLSIKRESALSLSDEAGVHPSLSALKGLWDSGDMAVLNSVGYPNPDRSHFRSMDIWHTASPATEYWQTGWLGRYLDAQCPGKPSAALEFDDTLSLVLKGDTTKGLALQDAKRLYESTRGDTFAELAAAHTMQKGQDNPVDYLYKTMSETLTSASYLYEQSRLKPTSSAYPKTGLGKDLQTIASLILADTDTSIYYVSLGSFDTHINQAGQQKRLFTEMNDALAVFSNNLKQAGKWDEVMVVTFSEFGRRVAQNASGGTDHGAANNMLFMGGGLKKKGLLNDMPDLNDLDGGDIKYQVDFRQVYSTLLEKWLGVDSEGLMGGRFEGLGFV